MEKPKRCAAAIPSPTELPCPPQLLKNSPSFPCPACTLGLGLAALGLITLCARHWPTVRGGWRGSG